MYIVIEAFGGPEYAIVCTNQDGTNVVFDSIDDAKEFAIEECQRGIVVEITYG
jgi:hypothetical protein